MQKKKIIRVYNRSIEMNVTRNESVYILFCITCYTICGIITVCLFLCFDWFICRTP